ncbi:hypothetical protein ES707_20477 [subsurface metagenome]
MNYLNLEEDKVYTLKILEEWITNRTYHWMGNKSVTCDGDACKLCHQNYPKRYEGWLDVELNGEPYRWSFPASVGVTIKDRCPRLLDAVISVKKSHRAGGALWDVTRVLVEPELALPDPDLPHLRPLLSLMADTLESMAVTLRQEADKLPGAG